MEPDQIILNQLMKAIQTMGDRMTQLEKSGLALPEGRHRVGETPRAGYVEPKPPDPSLIIPHQTSKTQSHIVHSYSDYGSAKKTKLYTFSGRRSYLEWERNLDEWFYYNNILKKERLAFAIDQLRDVAFKWWIKEQDERWLYKEPTITTWRDLKEAMRDEFAPEFTNSQIREHYPRRCPNRDSQEALRVVPQEGQRDMLPQAISQPKQRHQSTYCSSQNNGVPMTMEKNKVLSQSTLCKIDRKPDQASVQTKPKVSPTLDQLVYNSSTTVMMHLSLSKGVVTGLEESMKEETTGAIHVINQMRVQDTMQPKMLKEAKPVMKISYQ
ncbi:uncharacterized protein LOC130504195, partial [Raphanus sativus]|uniref:Uncharacterized protein LOC130504195 n=1 Tax=Raphanus sativus TaxID=3726 RepID=A0A9W3CTE4_RAPSA